MALPGRTGPWRIPLPCEEVASPKSAVKQRSKGGELAPRRLGDQRGDQSLHLRRRLARESAARIEGRVGVRHRHLLDEDAGAEGVLQDQSQLLSDLMPANASTEAAPMAKTRWVHRLRRRSPWTRLSQSMLFFRSGVSE